MPARHWQHVIATVLGPDRAPSERRAREAKSGRRLRDGAGEAGACWPTAEVRGRRSSHVRASVLARRARALLEALGQTPDAVARSLFYAHARGRPGDQSDTPLDAFVWAVVGADPAVGSLVVGESTLTILRTARWHREVTVPLPDPVRLFVVAFDCGRYPGLVRGREAHW